MDQLIIKKVNFYGDETASVTVDSGLVSVEVFCHLCEYREGDIVSNLLQVLDADIKNVFLADWLDEPCELQEYIKQTGPYSYIGCGKVIDIDNGIIEVLGVRIAVDSLPATIPSNGVVEFNITRLDLW